MLAVTALGVLLFVSTAAGYLDLRDSYADTRARLALADLHVAVAAASPAEVDRVRHATGVAEAEGRVVASLPIAAPRGASRVELRVMSLPDGGEPALDRVLLLSGALPRGPGEVLLEKHLAAHFGLAAGDTIEVQAPGLSRALRVSGVAVSAEYLWVARDDGDPMPSPDAFGVGWMRRSALSDIASAIVAASPSGARGLAGLDVAATARDNNQILVQRAAGAMNEPVVRAIGAAIGEARVLGAVPSDELPGVRLLQMDVDGYKGMAAFFPMFFLGVGAFIVASILSRLVDAQRSIIGTFMALGVGRARVLGHYLAYALALGLAGSAFGAALGVASGRALTHEYAAELGIPFVTARLHGDLAAWGVLLGAGIPLVAGWLPAFRASRLAPAEAMRPPRPSTGPLAKLSRRLRAPLAVRMSIRAILGRPVRALGTALGVAAALVLVLTTGAMLDSMRATMNAIFHGAMAFDDCVDLVAPMPAAAAVARLGAMPDASAVEPVLALPVRISAGGRHDDAVLQGLPEHAALLRSIDLDGAPVPPTAGGLVVTRAMAKKLGVGVGDEVRVSPLPAGPDATFRVSGLADAAMGSLASARLADAQRALGVEGLVTSAVVTAKPGRAAALHEAVSKLPIAARVQDLAAMRAQTDALMGLGWAMLGTMLAFGVVLAAAILFNTATLSVVERARDIATLRALGRLMREIALGLTLEHALIALLGLALGLPLAVLATREVLALYSNDLFAFPFVMSRLTVATAAAGVALVLLFAQWPALRAVARAPLADAVRSREG